MEEVGVAIAGAGADAGAGGGAGGRRRGRRRRAGGEEEGDGEGDGARGGHTGVLTTAGRRRWRLLLSSGRRAPKNDPMRVSPAEFRRLDLVAHTFLEGVPLHDVSAINLPGGGEGRSVADVRALFTENDTPEGAGLTRFLFWLRRRLGELFGWDRDQDRLPSDSYVHRWTNGAHLQRPSLVPPGTKEGPFHVVYSLPDETLSEIRNATVHAFLCSTLLPRGDGYRLYWGIYVVPVSPWTSPYMASIEPFRRFIVYPSLLRRIRRAWVERYGSVTKTFE